MGLDVTMFFTFYGLPLLKKELNLKVTPLGNAAMEMPMAGGHMVMPNIVAAMPGVDAMASKMMKNLIKKNGVASIDELRELAVEADVRMIACQMTLDLVRLQARRHDRRNRNRRRSHLHRGGDPVTYQPVHLNRQSKF